MIIIGYQGIGKSTLAGRQDCIDLESGNFWVNGHRDDQWARIYCNIAEHISDQGYTVFTSSHEVVRNVFLQDLDRKLFKGHIYIVFPSPELEAPWVAKLKKRYDQTRLDKDYKAYMNARDRYKENIAELESCSLEHIILPNMNYNLSDIVDRLQVLESKKSDLSSALDSYSRGGF